MVNNMTGNVDSIGQGKQAEIIVYLDWPPSINSYYVRTRNNVHISKVGRKFRESVEKSIYTQIYSQDPSFEPINNLIFLTLILFPPDLRKRDLDNHVKPVQDAVTHAKLWGDDCQIDNVLILRGSTPIKDPYTKEKDHEGLCVAIISPSIPVIDYSVFIDSDFRSPTILL